MLQRTQTEKWLGVLGNLRVDRKKTIAPHKPLLLLVVAELAEQGALTETTLPLTGELVFRFLAFATIVAERRPQRPDIRLPFYHLKSEGCWTPLDEDGRPATDRTRAVAARINDEFFACLYDQSFRLLMRRSLIARYFVDPRERTALYELVGIQVPPDDVVREDAQLYISDRGRGREARFRLTVVPAYNYTCALTGYRLTTTKSGSIVDAAHIHRFSDSRNNHPQNGIALCKNAHWLFDQGLWSLTDQHEVIVAKERFDESGEGHFLLSRMEKRVAFLPSDPAYWPDKSHLRWHREHVFNRF